MIPGEVITSDRDIELNVGRETLKITVANTGIDRFKLVHIFTFMKPMMLCNLSASVPKATV